MEPRIFQHQTQKQVLSPQIRQYLRLLQLPILELSQAVEAELSENPMLEDAATQKSDAADETPQNTEADEPKTDEVQLGENFESIDRLDENFREGQYETDYAAIDKKEAQKRIDFQESLITHEETLSDFILWQIRFSDLSEEENKIAEEIVGNIDEDGYLKASPEEIQSATNAPIELVQKTLDLIQHLDPPGIAARNLQEALMMQIEKKGEKNSVAYKIVQEHIQLLEKRDWNKISKILEVGLNEVKAAAEVIAHLEPKPGRTFYSSEPIAVSPDATIRFDDAKKGKLNIEIHDEYIPELRINSYYRRLIRAKTTDEKTKVFLREKLQNALNFLKAIKLRKSTLREITEQIIKFQPKFFERGFAYLVPLRLKDVAENIGIHESTVSRAIQGKYVSTPQGTIPFKSFFSTRLATTTGEDESQASIMEKVKKMVDKEDPKKPLSDQEIVNIMNSEGIKIARRTVAKYRDQLKILPSHLRRKR